MDIIKRNIFGITVVIKIDGFQFFDREIIKEDCDKNERKNDNGSNGCTIGKNCQNIGKDIMDSVEGTISKNDR